MRHGAFGNHIYFIGVAGKVGDKSDGMVVFVQNPAPVLLLGGDDFVHQDAVVVMPKALGCKELCFHRFEHKIGSIDLTVGMGIGYPYHGPFVFKTEHMIDFGALAKVKGLLLPDLHHIGNG